jgi:hypothetical protein
MTMSKGAAVPGTVRRIQHAISKTDKEPRRRSPIKLQCAEIAQEWLRRQRYTGAVSAEEQSFMELFIADMEVG